MKHWLVLLNDFCHDLFTGLWLGSFIALLVLRNRASDSALPVDLTQLFTMLCIGAVIALAVCGILRGILRRQVGNARMIDMQLRMARLKHALLGTTMLGGTGLVIAWAV